MSIAIFGKKIGMTRIFDDNGVAIPTTLVELKPLTICGHKTKIDHGYDAVILAFDQVSEKKINHPEKGYFKKNELPLFKNKYELKICSSENFKIGEVLNIDFSKYTDKVNISAHSIGKGFAGAMKRHNFSGLRASHGVSISHRSHGSTGACQDPGRVFKGKKMAGQLGNKKVTVKNLSVVRHDANRSLLFIKGAIPGHKNSVVKIHMNEA